MLEEVKRARIKAKEQGNPVLREKSFDLLLEKVKERAPKKILEIGTNVGLSGIAMLLTCETATLTGIEYDEEIAQEAKENYKKFGVDARAKMLIGDASEIIPMLSGEYDFIFLDGPKGHYGEYLPYLKNLLSKKGILFADNVLFFGYVANGKKPPHKHATIINSLRKYLKEVTTDQSFKTQVYDLEDGVSITEKL